MRHHWNSQLWLVTFIGCILLFVIGPGYRANVQKPFEQEQSEQVDVSQFPIVDYAAEKNLSEAERVKKEKKAAKYNNRHAPAINESSNRISLNIDWQRGLKPLPVDNSSAVIIGDVIRAEAHLSADETTIYSEFVVRVDEVLKNDKQTPLHPHSFVTVERFGGRVRFPSGRIVVATVNQQDLPHIGKRYVLFLTHDSILGGRYDEDFLILTGYELRGNQVFSLDKLGSKHPLNAYKGKDTETFLRDLRRFVANDSPITQLI